MEHLANTVATLNVDMKMDAKDFNKNVQKVEKSIKNLGSLMEKLSTNSENISKAFNKLAKTTKSVGIDLGKATKELNELAQSTNKVEKATEKVGKSMSSLATDVETASKNTFKMNKNLKNVAKNFESIGSSMGESNKGLKELDKNAKAIVTSSNKLNGNLDKIKKGLQQLAKEAKNAGTQLDKLAKAMDSVNTKANQLRQTTRNIGRNFDTLGRSVQTIGTDLTTVGRQMNVVNTSARRLRSTVTQTGNSFNQLASGVNTANNAINQASNTANQASNDFDGLGNSLKNALSVSMAGIGLGAGKMASDIDGAFARIKASLDVTDNEAKRITDSVKNIYGKGWGESLDEVAYATARVSQNMKNIEPRELESVVRNAQALSRVLDEDVSIVTRTANQLMEQFGLSAQDAFDMMAQGAKQGLNYYDDYLDTLNEYAPYFQKLGFDAKEMFDILISGSENGAFMLDKVGDAIKEFGIRSKDASALSMEAYSTLNLDGEKMTEAFAQGGEKAQQAFALVTERILELDDATKNAVGVALFGVMWEDLEEDTMEAMLTMKESLGDFQGKMGQVAKEFEESFGQKLQSTFRRLGMALEPLGKVLLDMATVFLPPITTAVTALSDAFELLPEPIKQLIVVLGGITMAIPPIMLLAKAMQGTAVATGLATMANNAYRTALIAQTGQAVVATTAMTALQGSFLKIGTALRTLATAQGWSMLMSGGMVASGWAGATVAMRTFIGTTIAGLRAISASLYSFMISPLGVVLATVGAITMAVMEWKRRQQEVNDLMDRNNEIAEKNKKIREGTNVGDELAMQKQREELDLLMEAYKKWEKVRETGASKEWIDYKAKHKGDWMDKTFLTSREKAMKDYIDTLEKAGATHETLTESVNARVESERKHQEEIRKTREEYERQQATMYGMNDARREEWETLRKGVESQNSYQDTLKSQIDSYIALTEVEEKTNEEKEVMAQNMKYLITMLGDSVTKYDANGRAIGLYVNKLKEAKQGIVDLAKESKNSLASFTEDQLSRNRMQIQSLKNMIEFEKGAGGDMAKDFFSGGVWSGFDVGYDGMSNKQIEEWQREIERLTAENKELMTEFSNSIKPGTYTPTTSSTIKKTAEEILHDRISLELDAYNYQRDMGRLSIQQEIYRLEQIHKLTKANTKDRMHLDVMLYEKRKELAEYTYNSELGLINHNHAMGKYSTEQYLKKIEELYRKHNAYLKDNIQEQWRIQEQMYHLQLEIQNKQLEQFRKNLEKANGFERDQLRDRKEYLDEAHEQTIDRIEKERDAKIKAYQDQLDAIRKANDKEEREREVANAKRLLKQYENSLTESGQARANELRNIIKRGTEAEVQEQIDMVIKAEEDRAKLEIDKVNAQYKHDLKLIEQQEQVLDKVYEAMQDKSDEYSAKYIELYGKSAESIQRMLQEGIESEMNTKVKATTEGFRQVNTAFQAGIQSMIESTKQAFQNVNLNGINLNPTMGMTAPSMQIVNFNIANMNVQSQSDAEQYSRYFAEQLRNIR